MDPGKLIRNFYAGRFEKRRGGRMDVAGTASADFLTPSGLRITNISRGGVALSGVVRVGARDNGLVQMYLPGSYELTTAVAQVSWSDRQGHVGLKFIQLQTIADEWKPWFAGPGEAEALPDETPGESGGEAPATLRAESAPAEKAADGSAAAVAPKRSAADYDLRKELALVPRRGAWLEWTKSVLRGVAVGVLISAAAGAGWYLWLERARYWSLARSKISALAPAAVATPSEDAANPAVEASPKPKSPRLITRVQVVEGEPVLESPQAGKPPWIERGKPISRPDPVYPGGVAGAGSEVALLLTIDQKGTINEAKILRGDPRLAREAASAAGHWRYTPFLSNSSPVTVKLPVTIKFETSRVPAGAAHR